MPVSITNQSTERRRGLRSLLRNLRDRLHARYTRAVVTSVACTIIFCSLGMAAVEIRHDVSFAAVVRFFSRSHFREADLSRLIYNPETIARLESLFATFRGFDSGGLVYADGKSLRFYPHLTERAESARRHYLENLEIYPRLVKHYFASDLESLAREMRVPPVRARLERAGVDSAAMLDFGTEPLESLDADGKRRLLRRTGRFIHAFNPLDRQPYELSFREKLHFYESERPQGRFVGIFQIRIRGWANPLDDPGGHAMSVNNHYLTITRGPGGRFVVRDYYQGERREHAVHGAPNRGLVPANASDIG